MKFQDFCLKVTSNTTDNDFSNVSDNTEIPERYKVATDVMVSMMKNKRDGFDRINVPFVENVFDGDYEKTLEEKFPDGEIPDGIIRTLAGGIFGEYPSRLDVNQKAIIKVLAAYICIQN